MVSPPPVVRECPTIIFGADVTHPPPGEDSSSSIAAVCLLGLFCTPKIYLYIKRLILSFQVVASMDWPEVTKYRALYSAQGHRDEIIRDLYSTHVDPQRGPVHGGMIRYNFINCCLPSMFNVTTSVSHIMLDFAGTIYVHFAEQQIFSLQESYSTG